MQVSNKPTVLVDLHQDLWRKYTLHGPRIEEIWRSWGKGQREKAVKAGVAGGRALKTLTDTSLGNVCFMIPEWNLRDLTGPNPDFLLDLLNHRATKSLFQQHCEVVSGKPGDHAFITESMRVNHLRHSETFRYGFTLFLDENQYGESYKCKDAAFYQQTMNTMASAVQAGLCVPQATGELIIQRQIYLLQSLNILVEDVLDLGSTSKKKANRPEKAEDAAQAALAALTLDSKPEKLSPAELLTRARDHKSALEDYLALCRTEPLFLTHLVNIWFFSRPELAPNDRGQRLPMASDKYISSSFLNVIHNAVVGAAVWGYICRLLETLVDGPNDRASKAIILQEMANVCQFEYGRVKQLFKRFVQLSSGSGYFRRVARVFDNGVPRVTMKAVPDSLLRTDPQLRYMLHLCEPKTDALKAVDWVKKIDELRRNHPLEAEKMTETEFDAYADLTVTATFIQSLSASLPLPSTSAKMGQSYLSRSKNVGAEIDQLKPDVDLRDFAVPIDNLLEPGMAERAMVSLDQVITEKTGTGLGFLYQDLVDDSFTEVLDRCRNQEPKDEGAGVTPVIETTPEPSVQIEQRRQKIKTRPAHSSIYNIVPTATTDTTGSNEPEQTSPLFKVKQATFNVFSALFSRSAARGSITWAAFQGAMADLNFSVVPRLGSVFSFFPPQSLNIQAPISIHRPHQARIEGARLLFLASRLKRVYGWGENKFEAV